MLITPKLNLESRPISEMFFLGTATIVHPLLNASSILSDRLGFSGVALEIMEPVRSLRYSSGVAFL